jgi:hypothetical protein
MLSLITCLGKVAQATWQRKSEVKKMILFILPILGIFCLQWYSRGSEAKRRVREEQWHDPGPIMDVAEAT